MVRRVGNRIDDAISPLIGAFAAMYGYRVIGKKPGESRKHDEWHARHGAWFRIGGVGLMLFAVTRMILAKP